MINFFVGFSRAHKILTVRSLLDTIDQFLHEFQFPDPYLSQKKFENDKAISLFHDHIARLDELDEETRQKNLILYLLAGNMFDWGAKEVSVLLETNNFGFEEALSKIPRKLYHSLLQKVKSYLISASIVGGSADTVSF